MKTAVFLQARLKSERLKNKMLLKLGGDLTVLEQSLKAAKQIKADYYVLLTDMYSHTKFVYHAFKNDFITLVGPEKNVLKRFCLAIEKYKPDIVIRITGDKVIIDPHYQQKLVKQLINNPTASFAHYTKSPLQQVTGAVFRASYLLDVYNNGTSFYQKQHVKPKITGKENVEIINDETELDFWKDDIKLSIDTKEDYDFMVKLFDGLELYVGRPLTLKEISEWREYESSKDFETLVLG